jgi:shikimate kinase / 3-dehydroquinate synthase
LGPALDKHVALIGFMGAGKSTLGAEVAKRLDRPFVDTDEAIEQRHGAIPELFERGVFREIEERTVIEVLAQPPAVIALGGGAVETPGLHEALRARAVTVLVDVDPDAAWARVSGSDRPLAQDQGEFRRLYEARQPLYQEAADARARDADDVVLAAGAVSIGDTSRCLATRHGQVEVVADEHVLELHAPPVDAPLHTVRRGEAAKTVETAERLWQELRLDRGGTLLAFGGGSTTDVAGFVAATYLRGVDWIAVPTTLVGQVDAAIGGKTAIDLPEGKNLVGAFHWPIETLIDPSFLATLPGEERRAGMAEVVKTGLLAGESLWELPDADLVRRCAAYKTALSLRDPHDLGPRRVLNLGHTFAHALEAASDYALTHGDGVALGLLAALRLSGHPTDVVEEVLAPRPVRVDAEAAWAALKRDKKGEGVFVLLEAPGRPVVATVPDDEARAALERLIAD